VHGRKWTTSPPERTGAAKVSAGEAPKRKFVAAAGTPRHVQQQLVHRDLVNGTPYSCSRGELNRALIGVAA
jgi:hypothetical protein